LTALTHPRRLSLGLALGVLLLDQLTKLAVLQGLAPGVVKPLLPGLLNLRLVWNNGAAFSLFPQGASWLGVISLGVAVALLAWLWRAGPTWRLGWLLAAGWLLGGTLGNGLDRWRLGAVVDFLELVPISFPVFNLADVAINLAVISLVLDSLRRR
jgi:signal peptidase II